MYISLLHTLMYISLLHNLIAKTYIRLKNFFPIHILHLICNAKLLNFFAPANSDFHGSQVHCKLHFHQPSYCSVVSQKKKKKVLFIKSINTSFFCKVLGRIFCKDASFSKPQYKKAFYFQPSFKYINSLTKYEITFCA